MSTLAHEEAGRQADFLARLPSPYLGCRQGHRLPVFAPTRNGSLPAGITAVGPFPDGSYDVLRTCQSCGLVLANHTDTAGTLITGTPRRRYPPGFLAKGIGRIPRGLATSAGWDRVADAVLAQAIKPLQE